MRRIHDGMRYNGFSDIEHAASYETRSFELPAYYSIRLALHDDSRAWELQFTHHKVFLSNPPAEIQNFEITHGFNLMTLGRTWTSVPFTIRFGGG